jgi:hypothetical protein
MEIGKNNNSKFNNHNPFSLFEMGNYKFTNEDYILKLNINHNIKFFKDELTIKYVGKGYNSIDFAVKSFLNFSPFKQTSQQIKTFLYFILK